MGAASLTLQSMLLAQPRDHMESLNPHQMYYNNNNQEVYHPPMGFPPVSPMQQQPQQLQQHPSPVVHPRSYPNNAAKTNRVCNHWQKSGSCPNKRCPYKATHTARNSPRYAKHMKNAPAPDPVIVAPRPNALEIKDPSPNVTPPDSREPTPPKTQVRKFALEIKEVPAFQSGNETESVEMELDASLTEDNDSEQPSRARSRFANMFAH